MDIELTRLKRKKITLTHNNTLYCVLHSFISKTADVTKRGGKTKKKFPHLVFSINNIVDLNCRCIITVCFLVGHIPGLKMLWSATFLWVVAT